MKKIIRFVQSNKLAVIFMILCVVITASTAWDKVRSQKSYVNNLSWHISNTATTIGWITGGALDDSEGNVTRDKLETAHYQFLVLNIVQQSDMYVGNVFKYVHHFDFIGSYIFSTREREEVLRDRDIEFMKDLQTDLENLAEGLNRCNDSFFFVDVKAVNRLLEEFDQKYDWADDSSRETTYKDMFRTNEN